MRVELFDGQDLKVVAQSTAMSDSVQGLASQAELIADGLLANAPMLPRRGELASADDAQDTAALRLPRPAAQAASGMSAPLIVGGVAAVAALGTAALGTWSWFYASNKVRVADAAQRITLTIRTPRHGGPSRRPGARPTTSA